MTMTMTMTSLNPFFRGALRGLQASVNPYSLLQWGAEGPRWSTGLNDQPPSRDVLQPGIV